MSIKSLLTIVLLVMIIKSYGQDSVIINPKPEPTGFIKYTSNQRLLFYPFSKARQIKIVSFHWDIDTSNGRKKVVNYRIPLFNDTIQQSEFDQIVNLTQSEIDTMTDILYNECSKWTVVLNNGNMCYFPRNAIIFYDQNDIPFEYIEICFECRGFIKSIQEIVSPEKCDSMFLKLQEFFSIRDIKTSAFELMKQSNSR
jgi:hypothetical protein